MSERQSNAQAPANLATPTDLDKAGVAKVCAALNGIVADGFALYIKAKNFHWHLSGPHFRDYHLLFDEQASQILAGIDPLAERVRKLGGLTLRSIGHVAKLQTISDNDREAVPALAMLEELMEDNKAVTKAMRKAHAICDDHDDVATASLLEIQIDEAERRTWFLFEASRGAANTGH